MEKSFKEISSFISKQLGVLEAAKEAMVKIQKEFVEEFGVQDSDPDGDFRKAEEQLTNLISVVEYSMAALEEHAGE